MDEHVVFELVLGKEFPLTLNAVGLQGVVDDIDVIVVVIEYVLEVIVTGQYQIGEFVCLVVVLLFEVVEQIAIVGEVKVHVVVHDRAGIFRRRDPRRRRVHHIQSRQVQGGGSGRCGDVQRRSCGSSGGGGRRQGDGGVGDVRAADGRGNDSGNIRGSDIMARSGDGRRRSRDLRQMTGRSSDNESFVGRQGDLVLDNHSGFSRGIGSGSSAWERSFFDFQGATFIENMLLAVVAEDVAVVELLVAALAANAFGIVRRLGEFCLNGVVVLAIGWP